MRTLPVMHERRQPTQNITHRHVLGFEHAVWEDHMHLSEQSACLCREVNLSGCSLARCGGACSGCTSSSSTSRTSSRIRRSKPPSRHSRRTGTWFAVQGFGWFLPSHESAGFSSHGLRSRTRRFRDRAHPQKLKMPVLPVNFV